MKIRNISRQIDLADNAMLADSLWTRMRGLLGRSGLAPGEGLVITRCNAIHMFFMRFAIDVVFVDKDSTVVGLVANIPPFGLSPVFWRAARAVELPAHTIARTRTAVGDHIEFKLK